jgi:hypothetical protein
MNTDDRCFVSSTGPGHSRLPRLARRFSRTSGLREEDIDREMRYAPHSRRTTSAPPFCSSHHCSAVSSSARWSPTLPSKHYRAIGSALDSKAPALMAHFGHRSASASRPRYCRLSISAIACFAAEQPAPRSISGRPNIGVSALYADEPSARPRANGGRRLSLHGEGKST